MGKVSGCRMLGGVVLLGAVTLAGCGGSKSSSTTGAAATQTVKRLEVTVVSRSAAVRGPRSFVAWAAEILTWGRSAEAAICTVTAGGQTATTDVGGKAVLQNVPVGPSGNIPVTINCYGTTSAVNITGTPGAVVSVTVEVEPGKVEVRAKSEHVSEPKVSQPSQPSKPPTQTSKKGSNHQGGDEDD
jgi:hypothetical protein